MQIFLQFIFIVTIITSTLNIIVFSINVITHNKQMKTRNYDIGSVLDRWANAEKQFQKDNKTETIDRIYVEEDNSLIDPNKVKNRSYSFCATKFNLDIVEADEFNNIVNALESKDEKPSLIVLDLPTNVKNP